MPAPNQSERAFWNAAPGRLWADRQALLDRLQSNVLARLMDAARPAPGEAVLDIGCGAGATTLAAARAVGPRGRVLGLDISEPLAARARETLAGTPNAGIALLDIQSERPEAPPFDLCLSRFGVMFFDDPVTAFANIRAALRPGGRLACATWAEAARNPWFALPRAAATARLGTPPQGDPDAPGPLAFRDPARVRRILGAAGWTGVSVTPEDTTLPLADLDEATALAAGIGPIPGMMRAMDGTDTDRAAILDTLRAALGPYAGPDGLRIPATINIVTATA